METTNIREIKDLALIFLMQPLQRTEIPFIISHPFYQSSHFYDGKNFLDIVNCEEALSQANDFMRIMIERAETFTDIIMLLQKPYRMTFLKYSEPYMSLEDFSKALGDIWTLSEYPSSDRNVSHNDIRRMFQKADKTILMDKDEFRVYEQLPERITVYRGIATDAAANGLSWTTDRDTAEWYANRFEAKGKILSKVINKPQILAYFSRRDEFEVVV